MCCSPATFRPRSPSGVRRGAGGRGRRDHRAREGGGRVTAGRARGLDPRTRLVGLGESRVDTRTGGRGGPSRTSARTGLKSANSSRPSRPGIGRREASSALAGTNAASAIATAVQARRGALDSHCRGIRAPASAPTSGSTMPGVREELAALGATEPTATNVAEAVRRFATAQASGSGRHRQCRQLSSRIRSCGGARGNAAREECVDACLPCGRWLEQAVCRVAHRGLRLARISATPTPVSRRNTHWCW